MKFTNKIAALALIPACLLSACKKEKKEPDYNAGNLAPLSIEFDNIVGGKNLYLDAETYTNTSGESFSISTLQYFISNIQLQKSDGTLYTVPQAESYFLIKEGDEESQKAVVQAPEGDYSSLTFTLGVDSLRSVSDVSERSGVLDPSGGMDGMYWSWNSGYIFFKMEGLSESAPADPSGQHKFRYHIGGFGGYASATINNIKTVTIDLTAGGIARVRKDRKSNIHLMVDIAKVFDGATSISIAEHPSVMFSEFSVQVANNFPAMFRHDHTEN